MVWKSLPSAVFLSANYTRTPVPALADDLIDVALLSTSVLPPALRHRFCEQPLFDDEIVFVISDRHPLAARSALEPADLRAYPIISSTLTPDPEKKAFMLRAFGKNPKPLAIPPLQLPLTEAMVDAASAGMGIAAMSEWIAAPYLRDNSGLVAKRLRKRPILRPWRIAYRKDRTEAALRLAAAIEHVPPRVLIKRARTTT
jgi:LysR family transcriptional regulator for metE and metH